MTAPEPARPVFSAAARAFLEPPRFAVIATLNPDGSALQAVVWYALEGDAIVFNGRLGRRWPSNLQRDRRVSFIVADGYSYIELRGEVEIDDDAERGQVVSAALARRYAADAEAAERQIAEFRQQHRVTFRLRPRHIFERLQ